MKKRKFLIYSINLFILLVSLLITLLTPKKIICEDYELMKSASELTSQCYDAIKNYKINKGDNLVNDDVYSSYMIGNLWSEIYTTDGDIKAKRSSINPNFAALYIKFFKQLGLKEGDEIGMICSGSFICLNISALAAITKMNLKCVVMASVGASSYGATDPSFNNVDMLHYLYQSSLISDDVSYASFGGYADCAPDFDEDIKDEIRDRIENQYHIPFIYNEDFKDNVNIRTNLILNSCPNLKLFINVGGTSLGLGMGESVFYEKYGLIKPSVVINNYSSSKEGLIDKFLNMNIPVITMVSMRNICNKYHMPYDPSSLPLVGEGDVYYETSYNKVLPVFALSFSLLSIGYIYYLKKKEKLENKDK